MHVVRLVLRAYQNPGHPWLILSFCYTGQRELFRGLVEEPNHGTIIFVTHRLEALQWADKVAVLEEGLITAFGTPLETQEDVRRVFELSKDD